MLNDWLTKWVSRQWFSVLLFFMGIVITLTYTFLTIRFAKIKEEAQFESTVSRVQRTMENRLDTYAALLRASTGLMVASENVTRDEFHTFAERLQLNEKYPGIQGIGYARHFSAAEKAPVLAEIRQEVPNFVFYPDTPRPEYTAITYLEPHDARNQAAIGYDMFSDPTRRLAMEKARDTGEVAVSGKVTLIQEIDSHKQAGFLMYVPVYSGNERPETIEERRQLLTGYIYAAFRVDDLFQGILAHEPTTGIEFSVYNGQVEPDNLMYSSPQQSSTTFPASFPRYTLTTPFSVGNETWQVQFVSNDQFSYAFERSAYPLYLATGLLISFILFVLSRLHYKAVIFAQRAESELETSQQALNRSRIQYRTLAENATDLVTVIDALGNVIYASPSHGDILGYDPEGLVDTNLLHFVHPDDFETLRAKLSAVASGGTDREEFRIRHRSGKYLTLEGIATGLLDEDGDSAGILIISRDVTERQAMEQRKDEFISIASHELKTPVTSLKVYTQYLQQYFGQKKDSLSVEFLGKMDRQLSKLTDLIRDLLDVSRIEAGRLSIQETTFDLKPLVEEVVEMLQFTTRRHRIEVMPLTSTFIRGDRDRVGQVLTNLLSNAIKYSPDEKPIILSQRNTRNKTTICVQDFGPGISASKQEKVFERFFRIEGPKQETFSGFGLGLYIAAEIVKRHRGKIWIESKLGQGATFCFSLPTQPKKNKGQLEER